MKRIFFLSLLLVSGLAMAQTGSVKRQAEQMGAALLAKNYSAFVEFTYPPILQEMGGTDKMITSLNQQMEGMEKNGMRIVSLTYDDPSQPIKEGDELQCTITQNMILELYQGRLLARTTLIGISKDHGKRWYFVDAGDRNLETMRQSLPNLSKSLKIPEPYQPKMLKN